MHLHHFFWRICGFSISLSMLCQYLFIVHLRMGYLGMIFGFGAKFVAEIVLMLLVLWLYAERKIFFIPSAKEVFKDFKEIILFSLNYSIGYYTVSMTFELVSLILIKTENGKTNLLIWISLAQLINSIYYVGYGIGSYGRALGNHFIGIGNVARFKESLFKCIKYHSLVTYVINIPFFIFAPLIGSMFMDQEDEIKEFSLYLRILAFFMPLDSMMPLLNSFMRLLSHNFFTMCLMIIGFAFIITGTSYVLSLYYGAGAFGPTCGLIVCNIVIISASLFRIYFNLDFYLGEVIEHANQEDQKNKAKMEDALAIEDKEISVPNRASEELTALDCVSTDFE